MKHRGRALALLLVSTCLMMGCQVKGPVEDSKIDIMPSSDVYLESIYDDWTTEAETVSTELQETEAAIVEHQE